MATRLRRGLGGSSLTDQPGRVVAVFVVSPILARKGFEYDDAFIKAFAAALFVWDLAWLLLAPPKGMRG